MIDHWIVGCVAALLLLLLVVGVLRRHWFPEGWASP
jgi:predicted metal-binding membrane protein